MEVGFVNVKSANPLNSTHADTAGRARVTLLESVLTQSRDQPVGACITRHTEITIRSRSSHCLNSNG